MQRQQKPPTFIARAAATAGLISIPVVLGYGMYQPRPWLKTAAGFTSGFILGGISGVLWISSLGW